MKHPLFIWLFLFLHFLLSPLQAQEIKRTPELNEWWKAGVARAVITPQEYMWMAGYAARDKPAEGKLHDLWAKALALEDAQGNRVLLITTDVIGFSRDLSLSTMMIKQEKMLYTDTTYGLNPVFNSYF